METAAAAAVAAQPTVLPSETVQHQAAAVLSTEPNQEQDAPPSVPAAQASQEETDMAVDSGATTTLACSPPPWAQSPSPPPRGQSSVPTTALPDLSRATLAPGISPTQMVSPRHMWGPMATAPAGRFPMPLVPPPPPQTAVAPSGAAPAALPPQQRNPVLQGQIPTDVVQQVADLLRQHTPAQGFPGQAPGAGERAMLLRTIELSLQEERRRLEA